MLVPHPFKSVSGPLHQKNLLEVSSQTLKTQINPGA